MLKKVDKRSPFSKSLVSYCLISSHLAAMAVRELGD